MFGSTILDVAIGVVFVYLLLAVFCTAIVEGYSRRKNLRADFLRKGVDELLRGLPDGAQKIHDHPLIANLARKGEKPSYIAPRTFAVALMDVVGEGQSGATSHERFRAAVATAAATATSETAPPSGRDFKAALFALAGDHKLDSDEAVEKLAGWFDQGMDRVSGWYKRKIQVIAFAVAIAVTLVANADTFHITARLWQDPALRAAVVAQATERANKPPRLTIEYPDPESPIPSAPVETATGTADTSALTQKDVAQLGQVTGWSDDMRRLNGMIKVKALAKDAKVQACLKALREPASLPCATPPKPGEATPDAKDPCCAWVASEMKLANQDSALHWMGVAKNLDTFGAWLLWLLSHRLAGWLMTAIAVSLGAPFWFEILNKLIKMRSTGDSPRDKEKAATQQPKTPAAAKV